MKKKIVLLVLVGVLLISIGTTFAFINLTLSGTKKQVITVGNLDLELQEDENNLTITNAMPMYDEVGMLQDPFTFRLVNKTANDTNYIIKLLPVNTNELSPSDVKYGLEKDGVKTIDLVSNMQDDVIDSGIILGNQTINYTLRLWIKDSVTENPTISNKMMSYKVGINVNQNIEKPAVISVEDLIDYANVEDLDYSMATIAQKGEMWTFNHASTEQTGELTDYRYIGKDPNNYIKFNDETWRIVGVFPTDDGTGNIENRIKIIRNENIGKYSWDNKPSGIGSSINSYGSNEWNDAKLQELLNSGAYYNRTSGTCPYGSNEGTVICDFTSNGLTSEAKSQITDTVYYLGSIATDYTKVTTGLVSHFYGYERGNEVYSGRSTSWTGKIGLIYPSDYGYATSGGLTTNREACLAKEMFNWDATAVSDCKDNNWLYDSENYQWTLIPFAGDSNNVFNVHKKGYVAVNNRVSSTAFIVRPVTYLKSDIKLTGTGTSIDPYTIK